VNKQVYTFACRKLTNVSSEQTNSGLDIHACLSSALCSRLCLEHGFIWPNSETLLIILTYFNDHTRYVPWRSGIDKVITSSFPSRQQRDWHGQVTYPRPLFFEAKGEDYLILHINRRHAA
jgi:hypothetical protein